MSYVDPFYKGQIDGFALCLLDQRNYAIDGWLDYSPITDLATFELSGWHEIYNPDVPPAFTITPVEIDDISSGIVPGRSRVEPISGPVNELGFAVAWNNRPSVDAPKGCGRPFPPLRPGQSTPQVTGFVAERESDFEDIPIVGRAIASLASGGAIETGAVELRLAGEEGGGPAFTALLGPDGDFEFSDVPTFIDVDGDYIRALYTITVVDTHGPALNGDTEVYFADKVIERVTGLNFHEIYLEAGALVAPPTHFIAVGDRGVANENNPLFFHYSLEYWQCGGNFSPTYELDGFTPAEIVTKCKALDPAYEPKKLDAVELLGNMDGYQVWAGVDDITGGGRSWLQQGVWVAEIKKTSTADSLMPIFTGNEERVQAKWATITDLAKNYAYAEQDEFNEGNVFAQWPRSMYKSLGTNSNTFVHFLVDTSGLGWVEMDGFHPGNDDPKQNTEEDLGRTLTFYATNTPWVGSASKPEPSQPPP